VDFKRVLLVQRTVWKITKIKANLINSTYKKVKANQKQSATVT
jgi:hypothetical protein